MYNHGNGYTHFCGIREYPQYSKAGGNEMAVKMTFDKEEFKKNIIGNCKSLFRRNIDEADKQQLFQ